jgi:cell wall-associated NlpC family hydrolase
MAEITREQIVEAARSFLGVHFLHQSIDPAIGLDCRGLLLAVAKKIGHQPRLEHRMNYARLPDPAEFRAALEAELERIPIDEAGPGDVVHIFFPRQIPKEATHAGIVAQGPYEPMLIHAFATQLGGSVIEEPLRRWKNYLAGAFRFPNLTGRA